MGVSSSLSVYSSFEHTNASREITGVSRLAFYFFLFFSHMSKKLFVGGLPYATTDAELNELFSQAGTVLSAVIIMDRMTNRSKGFGFVEMADDESADKSISMFNNQEYNGKKIFVDVARPMTERPPRREGGFAPRRNFN